MLDKKIVFAVLASCAALSASLKICLFSNDSFISESISANPTPIECTILSVLSTNDDEPTDYTQSVDDEGSDESNNDAGDDNNDDESGGDSNTGETDDDADSGDNADDDNNTGDDLGSQEKDLFKDLNPQQMAIKNTELLRNYIDLYDSISIIIEDMEKIEKTSDNIDIIDFINEKLEELKDIINYVISKTYIARTYIENLTQYKQSLLILSQINKMIKQLIQKPKD